MNDGLYPEEEEREVSVYKKELIDWVEALVMAVVFVVLLFTFVMRTAGVNGDSMFPTLENRDALLISRFLYEPKQGDIVVVTRISEPTEPLIKRVIATENQTVDIDFQQGVVSVDGQPLEEPYTFEPTYVQYDVEFPQTVPEGTVFVMGDNRNHSLDSRDSDIGMIDKRYVLGRAFFRIMPFERGGFLS
ncbi:signal peptidase I [Oscillospiraceae bacterium MB08-C2-2]|nr:signal peptidase I [Oscillospiraceae bacterium MB08-C2-2]